MEKFDRAKLRANGQWDYENDCPLPPKPVSPYGVPVASFQDAPAPASDAPLAPFEQRQVENLLNQFNASPDRIKDAFILRLTQDAVASAMNHHPTVVRFRG